MKKIFTLLLLVYSTLSFSQSLVISQVYGGGGNSGAPYNADYVELKNNSASPVSLSGYSIQYGSAAVTGAWTGVYALPAATIPAGGYYLIQMSSASTTNGSPLPTTDAAANPTISMAAANGRVALVNGTTALNACPTTGFVDLVGYGTASCFEGSGATAAPSATNAAFRKNNGCTDANNNTADFELAAPAPRNSASPVNNCSGGPSPALVANPVTIASFGNVNVGSTSASASFNLSGTDLTGAPGTITITAPANFQVSNDNSSWGASTTVAFTSATLASTPVYVRFAPQSAGTLNGNVSISGGGVTGVTVAVSGVGIAIAPTLGATALTAFGNVCVNRTGGPNSFNVNGVNLTNADITVGPLSGYTFATTAAGTYSASLILTQAGGTYSQDIYVRFAPTAVQSYNGDIPVSGGGDVSSITVAAAGAGVSTAPLAETNAATAVGYTTATLQGSVTDSGCTSVTSYGFEYSTTNGFANGSGTVVASSNLSTGNFSGSISGLTTSTTYYFKSFAVNAGGKSYSGQRSFTTLACIAPTVATDTVRISTGYYDAGVAGSIVDTGCANVTAYGIEYSSIGGFKNGSGIKVYSTNASGSDFTAQLAGLIPNTTYYFKAFATNTGGVAYGDEDTLKTKKLPSGFMVYSVPVVRGQSLHYSLDSAARGHYIVQLVNISGQVLFKKELFIQVGFIDDSFILPVAMARGIYTLAIIPDGKDKLTRKILVE